ncbi:hypothetical protein OHB54_37090 [Streptomyces sp. NBC_01007]|nr:hypothetical protein OHB54_37090 [Streptomyces sp. NBC_01007]
MSLQGTGRGQRVLAFGPFSASGRSYPARSFFEVDVRDRLLAPPGNTIVRTGHGAGTTAAPERPDARAA